MKFFFIPFAAFFTALGLAHFTKTNTPQVSNPPVSKIKTIVRCSPDWNLLNDLAEGPFIQPIPGAGKYTWNIHSKSDSAQFYFNQGINMYYGFHILESMASFMQAATFDGDNALIWWAQSLAYGPNINDGVYAASPLAIEAIQKAAGLSATLSPFEQALVRAMAVRYSADSTISRKELNKDYTAAMEKVYRQFPGQADAAALYADAMMLEHPWELWKIDGTPYSWTPQIRDVLEKGLMKAPEHPGINHYYIHVMEPSPFPQKAMASADRLGKLNPGLAHLVHMPSHIYLRTGKYVKGYSVNEEALKQYKNSILLFPAAAGGEFLYRLHNEHMLVNCGMHAGRKKYSIDAALDLQKSIDPVYLADGTGLGNIVQYIYMIPTLTMIRFEDWDGLLAAPAPGEKWVYASLLADFGKGMAYTAKNDIAGAQQELARMENLLKDSSLYLPFAPFSSAIDGAIVATSMLKGTIALKLQNNHEAIDHFKLAVERESRMVYNEPKDWLLNPKNYLAAAYAAAGQYRNAEITFKKDLNDNNENVWSLAGLHGALLKQNKKAAAGLVWSRLKKASAQSDIQFQ